MCDRTLIVFIMGKHFRIEHNNDLAAKPEHILTYRVRSISVFPPPNNNVIPLGVVNERVTRSRTPSGFYDANEYYVTWLLPKAADDKLNFQRRKYNKKRQKTCCRIALDGFLRCGKFADRWKSPETRADVFQRISGFENELETSFEPYARGNVVFGDNRRTCGAECVLVERAGVTNSSYDETFTI